MEKEGERMYQEIVDRFLVPEPDKDLEFQLNPLQKFWPDEAEVHREMTEIFGTEIESNNFFII